MPPKSVKRGRSDSASESKKSTLSARRKSVSSNSISKTNTKNRPSRMDEDIMIDGNDSFDEFSDDGARSLGDSDNMNHEEAEETVEQARLRISREKLAQYERLLANSSKSGKYQVDHLDHVSGYKGLESENSEDEDNLITHSEGWEKEQQEKNKFSAIAKKLKEESLTASGLNFQPFGKALKAEGLGSVICVIRKAHDLPVTSIALSEDGRVAYTGSKDCTIIRWKLDAVHGLKNPAPSNGSPRVISGEEATLLIERDFKLPGRRRTKADVARQLQVAKDSKSGKGILPMHASGYGGGRVGNTTEVVPGAKDALEDDEDYDKAEEGTTKTKIIRHSGGAGTIILTTDSRVRPGSRAAALARLRGLPDYGITGHWAPVRTLALSSDGLYLASGGDDKAVRVWDLSALSTPASADKAAQNVTRSVTTEALIGHKDSVTALTFKAGSHQLFSSGFDRMLKQWDVDSLTYVETLFGHQHAVTDLTSTPSGKDRLFSTSQDISARVWKLAEQSQLVFRSNSSALTLECVRAINDAFFLTGAQDGSLQLWGVSSKKPLMTMHLAHGSGSDIPRADLAYDGAAIAARKAKETLANAIDAEAAAAPADNRKYGEVGQIDKEHAKGSISFMQKSMSEADKNILRAKQIRSVESSYSHASLARDNDGFGPSDEYLARIAAVTGADPDGLSSGYYNALSAISVMPNSDIFATGSGDGFIRLWRLLASQETSTGKLPGFKGFEHIGGIPVKGIVTGLAFSKDGNFLTATISQEPRLGRWYHYSGVRNSIAVLKLPIDRLREELN